MDGKPTESDRTEDNESPATKALADDVEMVEESKTNEESDFVGDLTSDDELSETEHLIQEITENEDTADGPEAAFLRIQKQVFERVVPQYVPRVAADSDFRPSGFFTCKDCGDSFVLEVSLLRHIQRRSVSIIYDCKICKTQLTFFNRCNLLAHGREHQELENNMVQTKDVQVLPLPAKDIDLGPLLQLPGEKEELPARNKKEASVTICRKKSVYSERVSEEQLSKSRSMPKEDARNTKSSKQVDMTEPSNSTECLNNSGSEHNSVGQQVRAESAEPSDDVKIVNVESTCCECGEVVNENVQIHFLRNNRPDFDCKCKICNLALPTKCSLKAHERVHKRSTPFVCPECALEFDTFRLLCAHLKDNCFHFAKCVCYKCPQCNIVFKMETNFGSHIFKSHLTKLVFKCTLCPLACFSVEALNEHKLSAHHIVEANCKPCRQCTLCAEPPLRQSQWISHVNKHIKDPAWCTYAYKCTLCSECFETKVEYVVHKSHNECCGKKQNTEKTQAAENNVKHVPTNNKQITTVKVVPLSQMLESPTHQGNKIVQNGLAGNQSILRTYSLHSDKGTIALGTEPSAKTANIVNTNKLGNVPSSKDLQLYVCPPVAPKNGGAKSVRNIQPKKYFLRTCQGCKKPIAFSSAVAAAKTTHCNFCIQRESAANKGSTNLKVMATKPLLVQPKELAGLALPKQKGTSMLKMTRKILPKPMTTTPSLSTASSIFKANDAGKSFVCNLCHESLRLDVNVIKEHFKQKHKNFGIYLLPKGVEGTARLMVLKQTSPSVVENSENRKRELEQDIKVEADVEEVSAPTQNTSDSRKIKKKKKLTTKASDSTSSPFSSGQVICPAKPDPDCMQFQCSTCQFSDNDRSAFRAHITTHRTDRNSFQCMECGMCFVVKPSFKKHLFISHRIKDVDCYIEENDCCDESSQDEVESIRSLSPDVTDNLEGDELGENQCKVCRKVFENQTILKQHFRTHGMAFLRLTRMEQK